MANSLNDTMTPPKKRIGEMSEVCTYQGNEFGASYPDSICIGGQLFDADNCDSEGNLYEPLEYIPCPQCNHAQWLESHEESVKESGWLAHHDGHKIKTNPYRDESKKLKYPDDREQLATWWDEGFKSYCHQ